MNYRLTQYEITTMPSAMLYLYKIGCFRLAGVPWKTRISWYNDVVTGDIIFNWE